MKRFASRRTVVPGAMLAGALAVLGACGGEAGPGAAAGAGGSPTPGGTAVVCLPSTPASLDPFISRDHAAAQVGALLFTPLVRYGPGETLQPYLARSWEWTDGHRGLTFRLRGDLEWHDGRPVTAGDVAFTLRAATDSSYGYVNRADLATLDSVTVRDSATVELRFGRPLAAGLEVFALLPILPEHLLGGLDPEAFRNAPYHHEPVGSGPYRLVAWRSGGTIELARADGFPTDLGRDYLDRIVLRVIPEPTTSVAEMRTGGVDACLVGTTHTADMASIDGVRVLPLPSAPSLKIFLDVRRTPFSDVRVRRALSAALDRSEIAGAMAPVARSARSPLPADHPFAAPGLLQPDADPALADSLLSAAGWRRPPDGGVRTDPQGRRLQFTLAGSPLTGDMVTVVQAQLARVGFEVKTQVMEFGALIENIQDPDRRPPAVVLGSAPDKRLRPDFYAYLVTGSGYNISGYSNPAVDSAAARLRVATDSADLAAQYRVIERRVVEDVPIVYAVRLPQGLAVGPRLQGVEVGPNGPLAGAPVWWIPAGSRR